LADRTAPGSIAARDVALRHRMGGQILVIILVILPATIPRIRKGRVDLDAPHR
jgi:hypothetical protein